MDEEEGEACEGPREKGGTLLHPGACEILGALGALFFFLLVVVFASFFGAMIYMYAEMDNDKGFREGCCI